MLSLDHLDNRLSLAMDNRLNSQAHRLANLQLKLSSRSPAQRIGSYQNRLQQASQSLHRETGKGLREKTTQLQKLAMGLDIVSPLATLQRGYSITRDERGAILRSIEGLEPGDSISSRVADGEIHALVQDTSKLER